MSHTPTGECTSNCRKEGCPNCPHGKSEEEFCDICDIDGTNDEENNEQ